MAFMLIAPGPLPTAAAGLIAVGPDGSVHTYRAGAGFVAAGAATWGAISGTLADQTDLNSALAGKSATGHGHAAFTGADGTNPGAVGFVTAPAATDNVKFLKGTGAWAAIATADVTGLDTALSGKSSTGHGHADFTGADGTNPGTVGFVIAPAATDNVKFLKGNATWAAIATADVTGLDTALSGKSSTGHGHAAFTGADGTNPGAVGFVIAPAATDNVKFLKGSATWAAIATADVTGLDTALSGKSATGHSHAAFTGADGTDPGVIGFVPAPAATDNVKFLRGDGTWAVVSAPAGSVAWGAITGTLADQTDLNSALAGKSGTGHSHAAFTGADGTNPGAVGFVTAPAATDNVKFLRGDGTWATPSAGSVAWGAITGTLADQTDLNSALSGKSSTGHGHAAFTGADGTNPGAVGFVTAPAATDNVKFLKGNATWAAIATADVTGLDTALSGKSATGHGHADFTGADGTNPGAVGFVVAPAATDNVKFLKGTGAWVAIATADVTGLDTALSGKSSTGHSHAAFTGADGTNPGVIGFVPAPAATDNTKFLKGDGTWATPAGGGGGSGTALIIAATGLTAARAYRRNGSAWALGQANAEASAAVVGVSQSTTEIVQSGVATLSGLTPGADYFLSPTTPGLIVTPEPVWEPEQVRVYIGTALSATELLVNIDGGDVITSEFDTTTSRAAARATKNTTQAHTGGVYEVIDFNVVGTDTAGAVVTGINWAFTCPRAGRFHVTAAAGLALTAGVDLWIAIFVNGALYAERPIRGSDAANYTAEITDVVFAAINDAIDIRIKSTATGNISNGTTRVVITEN